MQTIFRDCICVLEDPKCVQQSVKAFGGKQAPTPCLF